jgi:hypothetical protein
MAGTTIRTERAGVESRIAMTRGAVCRDSLKLSVCMTLCTGDSCMTIGQWKTRAIVVEGRVFPTARTMAGGTIRAELPVMFIVRAVTGKTICGCACEDVILMTCLASRFRVFAFEFEYRKIMIEFCRRPAFG